MENTHSQSPKESQRQNSDHPFDQAQNAHSVPPPAFQLKAEGEADGGSEPMQLMESGGGHASSSPPSNNGGSAGAGPMQLKGWQWNAFSSDWTEVDSAEKGKGKPDFRGDDDGAVYDTDTGKLYRNVESYRKYTSRLQNPPFRGSAQEDMDVMLMAGSSPRIAPQHGAGEKLDSFMRRGVLKPGDVPGGATTSADDRGRPDQISVNKLGPFRSSEEVNEVARYATMNPANGALPVVLENGADSVPEGEAPDIVALAQRAHNSALAIIDPSGLGQDTQQQITMTHGHTELSLSSSIPSSSFVCLLLPIQMQRLVTRDQVARYKIRFVGSVEKTVQFNYHTKSGSAVNEQISTAVPDYENALRDIFGANRDSIFLTHIVRLGPSVSIPSGPRGSGKAPAHSSSFEEEFKESPELLHAMASTSLASPSHQEEVAKASSSSVTDTARSVEDIVEDIYQALSKEGKESCEDAGCGDIPAFIERFGALGVTLENAEKVMEDVDMGLMLR